MKPLTPLDQIRIPPPRPDETYTLTVLDKPIYFKGLKQLLGAADISKAGDRTTDLAPQNHMMREAARTILSSLTLRHIYDHPLTDDAGRIDAVMRVCRHCRSVPG